MELSGTTSLHWQIPGAPAGGTPEVSEPSAKSNAMFAETGHGWVMDM